MAGIQAQRLAKCRARRLELPGQGMGVTQVVPGPRLVRRLFRGGAPQADLVPVVGIAQGGEADAEHAQAGHQGEPARCRGQGRGAGQGDPGDPVKPEGRQIEMALAGQVGAGDEAMGGQQQQQAPGQAEEQPGQVAAPAPGQGQQREQAGGLQQRQRLPAREFRQVGVDVEGQGAQQLAGQVEQRVGFRGQVGRQAARRRRAEQVVVAEQGEQARQRQHGHQHGLQRYPWAVARRRQQQQGQGQHQRHFLAGQGGGEQHKREGFPGARSRSLSGLQPGQQGSHAEQGHEAHGAAADIGHSLRLDGVQGEQQGGDQAGAVLARVVPARRRREMPRKQPYEDHVGGVQQHVDGVETEGGGRKRPVQGIGQLEQRADARHGLPPGRQAVRARVVDDDTEVVELERRFEGVQIGQDGGGRQPPGEMCPDAARVHRLNRFLRSRRASCNSPPLAWPGAVAGTSR